MLSFCSIGSDPFSFPCVILGLAYSLVLTSSMMDIFSSERIKVCWLRNANPFLLYTFKLVSYRLHRTTFSVLQFLKYSEVNKLFNF